ncbi:vesicle-associated membrane protein 3-like isoform X2 [Mizuhopecten yessoensis]|uniref:vesicle-associated membrane protein 3-like isoform X2 n=1 Tax=Mizuhopecten yessoensis TaxID=6573 RepID=UPI000B45F3F5|nr:vesicle-associated membrane protein 3-like isoform X2 [Mizuhopecten yessoensis]
MAASSDTKYDKLDQTNKQVKEVTGLLKENVERVLDRGEKIDRLQERSEDLESNAINFQSSSRRLRKKMWCKNCKMNCIIAAVVFGIIAVIVIIVVLSLKPWEDNNSSGGSGGGGSGGHGNNTLTM